MLPGVFEAPIGSSVSVPLVVAALGAGFVLGAAMPKLSQDKVFVPSSTYENRHGVVATLYEWIKTARLRLAALVVRLMGERVFSTITLRLVTEATLEPDATND